MKPITLRPIFIAGTIIGILLLLYYLYETSDYAMHEIAQIMGVILICFNYSYTYDQDSHGREPNQGGYST
jgi:hypothetical protein